MKIKFNYLFLVFLSSLSGCTVMLSLPYVVPHPSSPLSVWVDTTFKAKSKTLQFLNSTSYDNKIIRSLAAYDFEIEPYSQVKNSGKSSSFDYGLIFKFTRQQKCMTLSNDWLIEGVFEISDLTSNKVVMTIEKGGVTGACKDFRDQVFPKLAEALNEAWGR